MPDIENGVEYDDGLVTFTKAKPLVLHNQALFSRDGLLKLMSFMDSEENPIPAVTPELAYKWQVTYADGSALTQFIVNPDTFLEEEVNSSNIDHSRISQLSVIANYPSVERAENLPTYTFVKESGKFFRAGIAIDTMYDSEYQPDSEVIYARKVNMTFGSGMITNSLDRSIQTVHTAVLQLMGWKVGGLHGQGPGCIIAVDERGHWRPYEYIEG
jgi:hypothetical protein